MRRHKNFAAGKAHNHGRVIKVARAVAKLYNIAYFKLGKRNFFGKRSLPVVVYK